MEDIIKKAIEGGFEKGKAAFHEDGRQNYMANPGLFFLDPLFWQALGKACGWEKQRHNWVHYAHNFYRINLTESWSAAVTYLQEVTK